MLEGANGGEALLTCEQHPDPIHLMVTDVTYAPRMTSRELADRLSKFRPAMKVTFCEDMHNVILHHALLDEGTASLQKPFTPEGLLSKVKGVLANPNDLFAKSGLSGRELYRSFPA